MAKQYQMKPSILSSIIKTKENIMKVAESDTRLKFKHIRKPNYESIDCLGLLFGSARKECSMLGIYS